MRNTLTTHNSTSDDSSSPSPSDKASPNSPAKSKGSSGRWWSAVLVVTVISLPVGWLLSYGATLPFFLGLFFFALFGLMIGGLTHRLASPGRPYGSTTILIGTTVIVLACWGFSIYMESRQVPGNLAKLAREANSIGGKPIDEYMASVESAVEKRLLERYPPGGFIGFVRWAVVSGEFAKGEIDGVDRVLAWRQRGLTWVLRCALSVAMLGFGVGSQTLQLKLDRDPTVRKIDEAK